MQATQAMQATDDGVQWRPVARLFSKGRPLHPADAGRAPGGSWLAVCAGGSRTRWLQLHLDPAAASGRGLLRCKRLLALTGGTLGGSWGMCVCLCVLRWWHRCTRLATVEIVQVRCTAMLVLHCGSRLLIGEQRKRGCAPILGVAQGHCRAGEGGGD